MTQEVTLQKTINKLFASKTPVKFIKSRPGPSGMTFKYVEVGYVINELNSAFGPFWEFTITDKQIGKKQVWVQGRLTIKDPLTQMTISKENFGGADIKVSRATGEPLDIANDLKGAVSDCTKKCASMFGIAADMYFKEQDQYDSQETIIDVEKTSEESGKEVYQRKYFAVARQKGFDGEKAKDIIKKKFNVEHMEDLTIEDFQLTIASLDNSWANILPGEAPRRNI